MCTWHHLSLRRYGNDWVWMCDECHRWVHANPAKAKELGFLRQLDSTINIKKRRPSKWKINKFNASDHE